MPTPWNAGHPLGHPGGGDRQRDLPAAPFGRDQVEDHQQRAVLVDAGSGVVDQPDPLADRVEADAEGRLGGRDQRAEPAQRGVPLAGRLGRMRLVDAEVDGVRVDADPAEQRGQHQARRAAADVHHDLELGLRDPRDVDPGQQFLDVALEDARGRVQVADLAGEGAPVLAARVDPVELALRARREVGAGGVEEGDVDRVGHAGSGADDDAAGGSVRRLQPGHRGRHGLQVAHVERAGGQRRDHRPLERTRGARAVTGTGDGVALLQRGRVGPREPDRELGRDLDVHDAADAARAEQRPGAALLPDHVAVYDRAGLDGLEGVDPHAAGEDRLLLDQALVADHDAVLDPDRPHHVGVLADHAAAQVRLRTDIDVAVDDRAVQEGAGT